MNNQELMQALNMKYPALSISRMENCTYYEEVKGCCNLRRLNLALEGATIYLTSEDGGCKGSETGFGFSDGLPPIPGGFGHFLSYGKGEGYPVGERVKCNPEVAEKMLLGQPQNVVNVSETIRVKPYESTDDADTVTFFVNPDQLSALIHLYNFRKAGYDTVIAPMVSGCASIFRIPFGELKREEPRGVIGNIDIFSRPHFDENTLNLTISAKDYEIMLKDAEESFLIAPYWNAVKKRLFSK